MNLMSWKFLTPYSLCVFAPLREINHPAIMQRQFVYMTYADSTISWRSTLREAACASNATWRFDKFVSPRRRTSFL
ncbi:hypothetical protein BCD64_05730 [Nostoc sp. MBR 210]|nr:hypothetical protein BCD64_05730 [Nostoc sp. MBR 210]